MSGKNLLEGRTGTITQSVDAVKALLNWKGHPVDPLPADLSMDNGRLVLVLSNKKDVYYTVTPTKCSCPSATYHPAQPCKHQRKHFGAKAEAKPLQDLVGSTLTAIRQTARWVHEVSFLQRWA